MKLPSFDHTMGAAIIGTILAGPHLIGWRGLARDTWTRTLAVLRWLGRPLRIASRHTGRHCDKRVMDIEAQYADVMATIRADAEQANRAIDDALASLDAPVPFWPAYLPAPAPPASGQAPDAATVLPPDGAAAAPAQCGAPSAGLGQPAPSAPVPASPAHGQRWGDITRPLEHPLMVAPAAEWRRHDAIITVSPDTGGITRTRIYTAAGLRRTTAGEILDDGIAIARPYVLAAEARRDAAEAAA